MAAGTFKKVPKGIKTIRGLKYSEYKGEHVELDIFLPSNTEKPYPLIIWKHRGGFLARNRSWIQSGALKQLERGYALASLSYTLSKYSWNNVSFR